MTRRPLVLVLAAVLACDGDHDVTSAPSPVPAGNGPRLFVTLQRAPASVLSGGSVDLVVAVARDGNDAYDGEVELTLATAEGLTAPPTRLTRAASSTVLRVSAAIERKHGDVPIRILARSVDQVASGEVGWSLLVRGAPGALDTSFGTGGVFVLGAPVAEATGIALQADGKIVLGGRLGNDPAVVRLSAAGALDTSFADGGRARVAVDSSSSTHDVVIGAGGTIVLGATTAKHTVLARFTPGGTLDATFGSGGVLALTGQLRSRALVVADDRVYVGGQSAPPGAADALHVARLDPSGALDGTWGNAGTTLLPSRPGACALGEGACFTSAMNAKAAGRVTLCASRGDGVDLREIGANGDDDPRYALTTPASVLSKCTAIANNTPLDFWAAGARDAGVFAIRHFVVSPTGGPLKLEPTFGPVAIPPEAELGAATRLAIGGPGVLVASADSTPSGGPSRFAVVRVEANRGALDLRFGGKGYVTTAIGSTPASSRALVVQSDGRILVAGTNGDMVAARYWP